MFQGSYYCRSFLLKAAPFFEYVYATKIKMINKLRISDSIITMYNLSTTKVKLFLFFDFMNRFKIELLKKDKIHILYHLI